MARTANPVEARSLLSLTALASNPPAYPRNPTQQPLEPLVLYIVRVPGSRDVFLSPLKPPTKSSISCESLNASLYFLHVSTARDEAILQTIEQEEREEGQKRNQNHGQKNAKQAQLNHIRRKPVPGTPVRSIDEKPSLCLRSPVPENTDDRESPFQGYSYERDMDSYQISSAPLLQPRPLPPLPTEPEQNYLPAPQGGSDIKAPDARSGRAQPGSSRTMVEPLSLRQKEISRELKDRIIWDGGRPLWTSDKQRNSLGPLNAELTSERHPLPERPRRCFDRQSESQLPTAFHITLIRRDPTHGNQWNVGTITNSTNTSLVASDRSITVEISTPGYKRFTDDQHLSLKNLGLNLPAPMHHGASFSMPLATQAPETTSPSPLSPVKFVRQVTLSHRNTSGHRRRSSSEQSPTSTASPSKSRTGNYKFTSPWNGSCTFTTGANGRSLKLRHTIPTSSSSSTSDHPHQQSPLSSVPVAELRFNLSPFGSGGQVRPSSLATDSLTSQAPTSQSVSEQGRLDLSLARERAGGGLRGKRAKLGKLIIEDDGLKMLDLVVAACMGVWWGAYNQ